MFKIVKIEVTRGGSYKAATPNREKLQKMKKKKNTLLLPENSLYLTVVRNVNPRPSIKVRISSNSLFIRVRSSQILHIILRLAVLLKTSEFF